MPLFPVPPPVSHDCLKSPDNLSRSFEILRKESQLALSVAACGRIGMRRAGGRVGPHKRSDHWELMIVPWREGVRLGPGNLSRRHFVAGAAAACATAALAVRPAQATSLSERFAPQRYFGTARVDHRTWDELLKRFVRPSRDGVNRVDYTRFYRDGRRTLMSYVSGLEAIRVGALTPAEQYAFWVNLYNAKTIEIVLAHYPVRTIKDIDITPGLFSDGPWGRKVLGVDDMALSLDDIENAILRPLWRDPRTLYAMNRASVGSPNLRLSAFVGDTIEAQLEASARDFINGARGARIDRNRLTVSSVYKWYATEFGADKELMKHIISYAEPALAAAITRVGRVDDYLYDWALNDVI